MCCCSFPNFQLFLVRHANCLTRILLFPFYVFDLIRFGLAVAAERSFFRERKEKYGWNFGAFGRLCVGERKEVVRFLSEPQVRGKYLGPFAMLPQRLPRDFLLFLDDPKEGQDPQTNRHQVLHDYFFNNIVQGAQHRITQEKPQVFKKYVDDFIEEYRRAGSPRKNADIEPIAATLGIRYIVHALYDVVLTDKQLEAMRKMFYTGGLTAAYLNAALVPIGNCLSTCCLGERTQLINLLMDMVESSPVLANYQPSDTVLNIPKRELAELLLALTGTAGILGSSSLTTNICAKYPREYELDTSDPTMVLRAVLELARLHPPVTEFNAILDEDREFTVGANNDKRVTFPKGTELSVILFLASYDPETFPNPTEFDPTRDNLMEAVMNFNSVGFNPIGSGMRTCPGRNIAAQLNSDVLVRLIGSEP